MPTQTKKKKTRAKTSKTTRPSPRRATKYIATDGEMVLHLEPDEDGLYVVTCPFEQGVVTQARTLEEAFEMARDAAQVMRESQADLIKMTQEMAKAKKPKNNSRKKRKPTSP